MPKVTTLVAFLQSQGGEITVSLSGDEVEEPEAPGTGTGIEGTTGEEIFTNAAPSCTTCHQLDAIGASGALGPDLSQVGGRLTPDEIRESILMPDAVIVEDCPGAPGGDRCAPNEMMNARRPQIYRELIAPNDGQET